MQESQVSRFRDEAASTENLSSVFTFEVRVHNETSESLNKTTLDWFQNFATQYGFQIHEAKKGKRASFTECYRLVPDKFSKIAKITEEGEVECLENEWIGYTANAERRHLWLEVMWPSVSPEALSSSKHKLEISSMSMGSFSSAAEFCCHWTSEQPGFRPKIVASFEYDLQIVTLTCEDEERGKWKLEIALSHLDKIILVTPNKTACCIYLFPKNSLKVFLAAKSLPLSLQTSSDILEPEEINEAEFFWKRQIQFLDCSKEIIGGSNAVCLVVGQQEIRQNFVFSRLSKLEFTVVTGNPRVNQVSRHGPVIWPQFQSFRLTYAWYCLMSRGFKVSDQVTEEFVARVNSIQDESCLEETIRAVTKTFDGCSICGLEKLFWEEFESIKSIGLFCTDKDEKDDLLVPDIGSVRRLLLTPTTILGLGEEWTIKNRVLRKFGIDRFIRISIRDDDHTRLTATFVQIHDIIRRITNALTDGLYIGDRHYRFLGCSNSQLREHGVWMYASDGVNTVDSLRSWMGDISYERCVATYISRLGQCFTSTRSTVEVKNVECIEDIYRGTKYCFTDGIGRISKPLARRVIKALNIDHIPSAFQIRFGGCKGVVALAPDLGDKEILQIRESMEKYSSECIEFEVAEKTRPIRLSLNRQVILLLSGLGVKDEAFFSLQDGMLNDMANMLMDDDLAITVISEANLGIEKKQLKESGIVVALEPFLRQILAVNYMQRFSNLLRKTHIEIPESKGRLMMGTVDEYDCLNDEEVFVQFSKDINKPKEVREIVKGNVVVTKNPCFHPGDMRKLKAVDKTELHHMVNCIVFPAKGRRPLPNQMSGSDLDGDMYFVCWEESLIPPSENKEPMDFTPQPKEKLTRTVTEADMIKFIGNYIRSDQLGVIANAHLVHADSSGIDCEQCLEIAQKHSDAVDFPKSGQVQKLPANLRPASYPDYMLKTDKPSYISNTVIAKLYHQCRTVELCNEFRHLESITPDPNLLVPGYEAYTEEAKNINAVYERNINELKEMFGVETDVELYYGGLIGANDRLEWRSKGDQYTIAEIIRLRLRVIKTKVRQIFYEEFGGENSQEDVVKKCQKASALYQVVYGFREETVGCQDKSEDEKGEGKNRQSQEESMEDAKSLRRNLGLPWIFWSHLCEIKKRKQNLPIEEVHAFGELYSRPKSLLQKISLQISALGFKNEFCAMRETRIQLFHHLSQNSTIELDGVNLILFGSTVTDCDSNASSLDIFVKVDYSDPILNSEQFAKTASTIANHLGGDIFKQFSSKHSKRIKIFNISSFAAEVVLFSESQSLLRTSYILAVMSLNRWSLPVLKVVLAWGKNYGITGNFSDSFLTVEELVIMFFNAPINGLQYGDKVLEKACETAKKLLLENHFLLCPVDQCTHLTEIRISDHEKEMRDQFEEMSLCSSHKSTAVSETDTLHYGRALIEFFRWYGTSRGRLLKEIPDPGKKNSDEKLLKLNNLQYIQLSGQMIQAYHSLATSVDISSFLNPERLRSSHFMMVLPNEVSSLFRYVEAGWAESIKRETGANVINIRKKSFKGFSAGHIIEAWGSPAAMQRVSANIGNIIGSAASFTIGMLPRDRWFIDGSHRVVFEGIPAPNSLLRIVPYNGLCQDCHEKCRKQIPQVIDFEYTDVYSQGQVALYCEGQRDFIRKQYKQSIHGGIRAAVSFGVFYLVGHPLGKVEAGVLNERLVGRPSGNKAAHVGSGFSSSLEPRTPRPNYKFKINASRWTTLDSYTMQQRMENPRKTAYSAERVAVSAKKHVKGTFIPANDLDVERLLAFLKRHNFSESAHRYEYRVTVELDGRSGIIVLNEKFELTLFHLQDIKWIVVDVLRKREGSENPPKDIRIQLHSRPVIMADEMAKRAGCQDLLENAHQLLRRNANGEVNGIKLEKYKNKVTFMRYKDMTSYRFKGKTGNRKPGEGESFFHSITIKLNRGKEYRKPVDGIFNKITEQTQVILESDIPDLEDKDGCDEFFKQIYHISKEFARSVID